MITAIDYEGLGNDDPPSSMPEMPANPEMLAHRDKYAAYLSGRLDQGDVDVQTAAAMYAAFDHHILGIPTAGTIQAPPEGQPTEGILRRNYPDYLFAYPAVEGTDTMSLAACHIGYQGVTTDIYVVPLDHLRATASKAEAIQALAKSLADQQLTRVYDLLRESFSAHRIGEQPAIVPLPVATIRQSNSSDGHGSIYLRMQDALDLPEVDYYDY